MQLGEDVQLVGGRNTVDGRNLAPSKRPWNDDALVNTNKQ